MARTQRLNLPGVPQHVVQRGNNRQACFFNDSDCVFYLKTLLEACQKHQCALHAFVLMTNHAHLLITPQEGDGVSRLMMDLGRTYVRYVNNIYHRTGTLWEGRFKSSMVDSTRYLIACYRYIELNPVRANMVRLPAEYAWSSYHANALGEQCELITPHERWLALGRNDKDRRRAYLDLFTESLDPKSVEDIRFGVSKGLPVGGQNFKRMIETKLQIRLGTGKRGRRRAKWGQVQLIKESPIDSDLTQLID